MLVIYSNDLTSNRYTPDFTIKGSYQLVEFSVQNSLYNINSKNHYLPFQEDGEDVVKILLTDGFYSATELASHLQTRLQEEISANMSVSYSTITGNYTFQDDSSIIFFRFNDEDETGCLDVIGFLTGGAYATTQISDNVANLTSHEDIYVEIEEAVNDIIKSKNFKQDTFIIPIDNVDFGNVIRYRTTSDEGQYTYFRGERQLTILMRDKNKNIILFNGAVWKLILKKISDTNICLPRDK